jgi:hypothetical protein
LSRHAKRETTYLVGQLVADLADVFVVLEDLLAHLVERRLHAGAVVKRKDLERGRLDGFEDGVKVDIEFGEEGLCE